ncbi:hypothetical protein JQK87_33705 [Streptomyces sp. G44]|uniref:hypothetical protein n=1 Tax=Streptomyces sp. G44 TaxID=2807632 RepID=UPI00196139CA|nr:hypothetical protein [Streptomyces sp. G44]MBM7173256.1 hypothetical protein [Streptomyces sp. G44]
MRRSLVSACAVVFTLAAAVPATAGDRTQAPGAAACGSHKAAWAGTYKDGTQRGTFEFRKNGTATLTARSGAARPFTFRVVKYANDDWRARLSFADTGGRLADLVPRCDSRRAPRLVTRFDMLGRADFVRV